MLTFRCERRAETQTVKKMNEPTEIKVFRKFTQKSLRDTFGNSFGRESCETEYVH
jgi:hypothetical protein